MADRGYPMRDFDARADLVGARQGDDRPRLRERRHDESDREEHSHLPVEPPAACPVTAAGTLYF